MPAKYHCFKNHKINNYINKHTMNTGILKKTDSDLTEVHVKAFDVLSSPSRKSTGSSAEEEGKCLT